VNDRWVIFSSPLMLHRVLPSLATQRLCLTIWFSTDQPQTVMQPPSFNPVTAMATSTLKASTSYANPIHSVLWPGMTDQQRVQSELKWSALAYLLHPINRKHVTRLIYRHEWSQSLTQAHIASDACNDMIIQHDHDCDRIQRAFQVPLSIINNTHSSVSSSLAGSNSGGLPLTLPLSNEFRHQWPDVCRRIDSLVKWF
jgi:hypothetical protein